MINKATFKTIAQKFYRILTIATIAIVFLFILSLLKCNHQKDIQLKTAENLYKGTYSKLTVYVNKVGEKLMLQKQLIVDKDVAISFGLIREEDLKNNNLKSIQTIVKLKEYLRIQDTLLAYNSEPQIVQEIDSMGILKDYIKTPIAFSLIDTPWCAFGATVLSKGAKLDSLIVNSRPSITLALQRAKGLRVLWTRAQPVVMYKNDNPYIRLQAMENVTIKEKPKFYERRGLWLLVGAAIGIAMMR